MIDNIKDMRYNIFCVKRRLIKRCVYIRSIKWLRLE